MWVTALWEHSQDWHTRGHSPLGTPPSPVTHEGHSSLGTSPAPVTHRTAVTLRQHRHGCHTWLTVLWEHRYRSLRLSRGGQDPRCPPLRSVTGCAATSGGHRRQRVPGRSLRYRLGRPRSHALAPPWAEPPRPRGDPSLWRVSWAGGCPGGAGGRRWRRRSPN